MNNLLEVLFRHGYVVLFMGVLGEQLGLPLPAGMLLFAGGAAAGGGQINFAFAFLLAFIACILSDNFWYQIGLRRGSSVLPFLCRISLNPDSCVNRTKGIFARHGAKSLLVVKFFPGVNTIAAPMSGIMRMRRLRFLLFDSLGACIWVGAFMGFGYLFSGQIEDAAAYASRIGALLWVIIVTSLLIFLAWKYIQRQRFLRQLRMARITPEELKQKIDGNEDFLLLDVRNSLDFEADPQIIPGALYLPLEEMQKNLPPIPREREVVLYCD